MFNPSRDQVRQFFCEAWRKHRERLPLVGAELAAADLAARHPEYQPLLDDPDGAFAALVREAVGADLPFFAVSAERGTGLEELRAIGRLLLDDVAATLKHRALTLLADDASIDWLLKASGHDATSVLAAGSQIWTRFAIHEVRMTSCPSGATVQPRSAARRSASLFV